VLDDGTQVDTLPSLCAQLFATPETWRARQVP
jgi:hypothetical protein